MTPNRPCASPLLAAAALTFFFSAAACAQPAEIEIRVRDELGLSDAARASLLQSFRPWARRVYAYLGDPPPRPVNLVLTRRIGIGYYASPNLYLPPADADEMLETWVHELAHHVTGHQSNFFFKEGIASHVLEALFAEAGRVPQGFPQYGQPNDAWVAMFDRSGRLPALSQLMSMQRYDGSTPETDFRSWQVYVIGASFVDWLIRTQGLEAFERAFAAESLDAHGAEWERRWLADIRAAAHASFDPMRHFPDRARYRRYAARLDF